MCSFSVGSLIFRMRIDGSLLYSHRRFLTGGATLCLTNKRTGKKKPLLKIPPVQIF